MTTSRILPRLLAGLVCAAFCSARAGDPPAAAPAPALTRNADATKARQDADRQRLIAKLRDEAPKTHDKPSKASVLELPIFHRHDRP
jgi:hypothetical protein